MHQMKDNFVNICLLISLLFCIDIQYLSVWQPSRGWLAVMERGKITQSFRRERVCKFAGKKRRLYNSGKTGNL